jgi:hypothetical protein
LVGARLADYDHGPRPLAGNAGPFPRLVARSMHSRLCCRPWPPPM